MKRTIAIFLIVASLLMLCACGASIPSEVETYAKRHDLECVSVYELTKEAVVGKQYIVYGTVSWAYFQNYEDGSKDLEDFMDNTDDERLRTEMYVRKVGTMHYSFTFEGGGKLTYDTYNYNFNYLNINKGDEVAFLVECKDGYLPGEYEYEIIEKVWEKRHSDTTVEEDHDAELATEN